MTKAHVCTPSPPPAPLRQNSPFSVKSTSKVLPNSSEEQYCVPLLPLSVACLQLPMDAPKEREEFAEWMWMGGRKLWVASAAATWASVEKVPKFCRKRPSPIRCPVIGSHRNCDTGWTNRIWDKTLLGYDSVMNSWNRVVLYAVCEISF